MATKKTTSAPAPVPVDIPETSVPDILGMGRLESGEWGNRDGSKATSVQWNDAAKIVRALHPLIGMVVSAESVAKSLEHVVAEGGKIALKIVDPILEIARKEEQERVKAERIAKFMALGMDEKTAKAAAEV